MNTGARMDTSASPGISTSKPAINPAIQEQRLFCRVCQKNYARYTCPRCNSRYCCVQCYKAHSLRCTESFNQENCIAEMKDLIVTDENKRKMVDTLKRIHFDEQGRSILDDLEDEDHDMDDDRDGILSDATLQRLEQEGEFSLDCLTAEERKAFLRSVAAGELSHMIKPWEPWWCSPHANSISLTKQGTRRVQVLDKEGDEISEDTLADIPPPPDQPLAKVSQLTSGEPSPLLAYHLVEVLYSYCFTLRLFNGDWRSEPLDAGSTLLSISEVLGEAFAPESVGAALNACLEKICSPIFKHTGGYRFGVALFGDTEALLKTGKPGIICALADLLRLLEAAQSEFKSGPAVNKPAGRTATETQNLGSPRNRKSGGSNRPSLFKKLQSAARKVYFLTCWTNHQESATLSSLIILVADEKSSHPVEVV